MATFLGTNGAPPRQTPQLQIWLSLLAAYVDEKTALNVYHSTSGAPTIPTDLDALFTSTPTENVVVFWMDTSSGFLYTYMYDVGTASWITGPSTAGGGVPEGTLVPYAGDGTAAAALSPDWLICYGQAVSRAAYADLFATIGTTYGSGDGSTTFNLPDLRGRIPVGMDNMGGSSANRITDTSADSIGGVMGAETHTLTVSELPSHNHETYSSTGGSTTISTTGGMNSSHRNNDGLYTFYTGGDGAHNNMQPSLFVNYIIKT